MNGIVIESPRIKTFRRELIGRFSATVDAVRIVRRRQSGTFGCIVREFRPRTGSDLLSTLWPECDDLIVVENVCG